jgi:hypothetical protein
MLQRRGWWRQELEGDAHERCRILHSDGKQTVTPDADAAILTLSGLGRLSPPGLDESLQCLGTQAAHGLGVIVAE